MRVCMDHRGIIATLSMYGLFGLGMVACMGCLILNLVVVLLLIYV